MPTSIGRKTVLVTLLVAVTLYAHKRELLLPMYLEDVKGGWGGETSYRNVSSTSRLLSPLPPLPPSYNPRRFSDNTTLNVQRGMNFINQLSSARIAAWTYIGCGKKHDHSHLNDWTSGQKFAESKILRRPIDVNRTAVNDTIYVNLAYLQEFVRDFLPLIRQDFVLLTDNWKAMYPKWIGNCSVDIVDHPHVLKWFSTNIGNYTGGMERHDKVAPFPLGLKTNMKGAKTGYRTPSKIYRKVFQETLDNPGMWQNKNETVFAGYIRITNQHRKQIPNGRNLPYDVYLRKLANAKYVISPNGDHPDCHRHYEAIGMGAIPITELDAHHFRHLNAAPTIFKNSMWNMTHLQLTLPQDDWKRVNRNMIFEEYWIEYVERTVGRPLRWWDVVGNQQALLKDFVVSMNATAAR